MLNLHRGHYGKREDQRTVETLKAVCVIRKGCLSSLRFTGCLHEWQRWYRERGALTGNIPEFRVFEGECVGL